MERPSDDTRGRPLSGLAAVAVLLFWIVDAVAWPAFAPHDPQAIAAQLEEEADKGERTDVAPSLTPDAKAVLLAAYEESRQLGASYVGPEHVLLALARPAAPVPRPITRAVPLRGSLIHVVPSRGHEPAAGDDGRDGSRPLEDVGSGSEIDVDRDEDDEHPRQQVVDQSRRLDAAEDSRHPTEPRVEEPPGVRLPVHGEARHR